MSDTCQFSGCTKARWRKGHCLGHYSQLKRFGECSEIRDFLGIDGDLADRINSKIQQSGDCWEWIGARNTSGYGTIRIDGRTPCAHRIIWELLNGPVPDGLELDHQCWNAACVNPAHLKPVTHKQNVENQRPGGWGKLGIRGVRQTGKSRYSVFVRHEDKQRCYGSFATKEEAAEVARAVRNRLFSNNLADRVPH